MMLRRISNDVSTPPPDAMGRVRQATPLLLLAALLLFALLPTDAAQAQTPPSITWAGSFTETSANDGTVQGSVTATLTGDTFNAYAFALAPPIFVRNEPTGLGLESVLSSDTVVTLTLTGRTANHNDPDDVNDLTVLFLDNAFTNSSASQVANSTKNDLEIDFNNPRSGLPGRVGFLQSHTLGVEGGAQLTWLPVGGLGAGSLIHYELQYARDFAFTRDTGVIFTRGLVIRNTAPSHTVTGLTSEVLYYYRIRAITTVGTGPWSTETGDFTTIRTLQGTIPDAPSFDDGRNVTRTLPENTPAGQDIGAPLAASDSNDDALIWNLGGADADAFAIDESTGQLRTRAGVTYDYENETKRRYTVSVSVSDDVYSDIISVTITLTDVNEPPIFTSLDFFSLTANQDGSVTPVPVGVVSATDLDAADTRVTYSIVPGDDSDKFAFDAVTGALSYTDTGENRGTTSSLSLTVRATGGTGGRARMADQPLTVFVNDPPAADAGSDQQVAEGASVILSGSGTDPERETLRYLWTQTSGRSVILSGVSTDTATFAAPEQLVSDASLVFSLVVIDARNAISQPDTVTVTVTAGANDAPTADAGADQRVAEGASVTLAGSGTDPEGEALTYAWTQDSGATVSLSDDAVASPTFTAPTQLVSDATLVFSLVVTDARGEASSADTVTVTVTAGANDAPTADAGSDQRVAEGAVVTLANLSTDPEGEALTYAWTQISGQSVTLDDDTAQSPTFTALTQLVSDATLEFSLVVTDARGAASAAPDTVTVTVTAGANDAPTADAGDGQTVGEGAAVTLAGSGTDPEEEALTYAWTQTSGANVSLDDDTAAGPSFTAPTQLASDAALVFSLVVTDARGAASAPDTVTVTVTAGANDAPTADAGDNQTVEEGEGVPLYGSGTDPENEALAYAWTQTSGPSVILYNASTDTAAFISPEQLVSNAALVFSLVVTDARGSASSPDTVTVTVTAGSNDAPTADAGENQTVGEGAAVTLAGSGTDPENEALTYAWTQTSGQSVTLDDATAQGPAFTAPTELVSDAVLVFSLVVTDARGAISQPDTVTVTVTAGANDAPTADAGENQTVGEGAAVTLAGSGTDPEALGEALTYAWTQTGGESVTLSGASTATASFTAPTELVTDAVLVFSLVVTDAGSSSWPPWLGLPSRHGDHHRHRRGQRRADG